MRVCAPAATDTANTSARTNTGVQRHFLRLKYNTSHGS